ncbi:MAG TPA: stalk domain-containing protein [Sedimentibacter sp.]|nr:stalk domain-containing protein [Sedimentibacter sp.]HQC70796.1 stalk domain-containing protein [Sedimentibacter sp.]HQO72756.1 stalk domain-containing protein [Sedimentibacter sp.]HQO96003.1 stalk domain-containing protein [Sedimentibacter sp.]
MRIKYIKWPILILLLILIALVQYSAPDAYAEDLIKIVIDGKRIKPDVDPYISNDRTLVPIRVIAEELDSVVEWDNDNRAVHISKEDIHILLRIDSYLVEYTNDNETSYTIIDVTPQITGDRTFVPIRLISNALGVKIEWDNDKRTVYIDSSESSEVTKFFDVEISSVKPGQTITGTTELYTKINNEIPKGAKEIKYLLLDRDTAKGFVIAGGSNINTPYEWVPAMEDNGQKVLVSAFYDAQGNFLAGDSIPVTVKINPQIELKGIREGQLITAHSVPLSTKLNFSASYVKYEMINPDNGAVYLSPGVDPEQSFTMIPVMEDNGNMSVRVIAYDTKGNAYKGEYVNIGIDVDRYLYLGGVKNGQTIDGSVTLLAQRNFNVTDTEYIMVDNSTGEETLLFKSGYGSYSWFPGPEDAGSKDLYVRVKDTAGNTHVSSRVTVNVVGTPKLMLQGVGPGQVLTQAADLNIKTNVNLDSIKYILTNVRTGNEIIISEKSTGVIIPEKGDDGTWTIRAQGTYGGRTIKSEEVKFTIYTGQLYSAKPVIEKDKYLDLVSGLAVNTRKTTGMSAALQVAQAILETGWGQSVPVDKYDGKFSYNLFGIKGEGTKGSVTSNTWEEYNGVAFRIDAEFRAYNNEKESWQDHKDLLLLRERYAPFREVMYDSTKGAWALKRCGYATDSQYAIKLIDIIERYDLKELDEVTI